MKGKNRFNFSQIKQHQLDALNIAINSTFVYKISDVGLAQKPFDVVIYQKTNAYIVIFWEDEDNIFYMLDVNLVNSLIEEGKNSLSKEEIKGYSNVFKLK